MLKVSSLDAFYDESQVLFDIGIEVGKGERVAILGRNGAGKSSLLKSIMDAGPRRTGQILWNGSEMSAKASFRRSHEGIVLVPEDRRILGHLTVIENLLFAAKAAAKSVRRADVEEMLERFPILTGLGDRHGTQLSGGQQQMVAVARGFMASPQLLLLDEPTEGLAPIIVAQLAERIIEQCKTTGTALLLCEQNVAFARRCTERLYVIDAGGIVFSGPWAEFDDKPEVKSRYLAV